MPNFPIVDTHLHLWDPSRFMYPWLNNVPPLNRKFLLPDFNTACSHIKVDAMVFLECDIHPSHRLQEARWVASLAEDDSRIKGLVASSPLEKGDEVRPHLEQLSQIPLVKGIRRLIQSEADVEFCLRPDFVKGLKILAEFNFSFDICIRHHQLASVIRMVGQCPEVSFILDHIGKPDIQKRLLEPWKREIGELAKFPNVYCKVSGLATEADMKSWKREDLKPYIDQVIECFGFDRVVYGGDWPVSTLATDYPRWVETLEWALAGCSEVEVRKLFRENGLRFYKISNK